MKRKSRKGDKTEFDFTGLIHRLSVIVEAQL